MAFLQPSSLLFVGVLFVAASMSCATPIDVSGHDAGLAGRKVLSEDYGFPQHNSQIQDNPLLQISTEKRICGKAPCSHPSPAPVDNGDTVVFLDDNNAWEVIVPGGKKPPVVMPPCQVGACDQALTHERDFVGSHIGPVGHSQPGPARSPESNDYPQLATWSSNEEAVADELDVSEHHINKVDYPQSGPDPSPDSYGHPLPAAWSLHDVPCVCPDPMQTCFKGFCIEPPYVDSVNKVFNRGGPVLP